MTGGIASGKSTVSKALVNLGAKIIDADQVAHSIIEPDKPAWKDIVDLFGPDILNDDKSINRDKLGQIVFNNPDMLQKLNQITHPRVMEHFKDEIYAIKSAEPQAVIFMEVPLLYETQMERICDEVWVVWVDRETQINRLMHRDNINREDAIKRIESQMQLDEKAEKADKVIDNRHGIEETIEKATKYFYEILQDN